MVQAPPSPSSSVTSSSSQSTPSTTTVQVKFINPPKVKGPLSFQEVGIALDASVNALAALGYDFCLFGSAGCSMYGMDHRCPHVRLPLTLSLLPFSLSPSPGHRLRRPILV